MIFFIAINSSFVTALFFEETIKIFFSKHLDKCCKLCKIFDLSVNKENTEHLDFYKELKLSFLLSEYIKTSMELERYNYANIFEE